MGRVPSVKHIVCGDAESDDDVMAYRYNEENTLSWLTLKVCHSEIGSWVVVRGADDVTAYRYNEEKTSSWLTLKVCDSEIGSWGGRWGADDVQRTGHSLTHCCA